MASKYLLFISLLGTLCFALAIPVTEVQDAEEDFPPPSFPWDEEDEGSSRLIGGTVARDGSAPHMVALTTGSLITSFLCGGSLISARTILTAAHCIDHVWNGRNLPSSLRAVVGTNRWNRGGDSYRISHNVTHPHYVRATIKNDIGFFYTTTNVVFRAGTVQPVTLNFGWLGHGIPVRVNGWGSTRTGGSTPNNLQELSKQTVHGGICISEVARIAAETNVRGVPAVEPHIELCTFHSPGVGNCHGDSGSALVLQGTNQQVGVVSWGIPCARGAPDMYARVSAYRDFMVQNIV